MTDAKKQTRRDWFRLRVPKIEKAVAQSDVPHDETRPPLVGPMPGLAPIADPVNHDGLDLSELPPMREAILSRENVIQLFADIESLGSDILLMQRSHRAARATAARVTAARVNAAGQLSAGQLSAAQDSLLSSTVSRLQIRYRWQATNWIDTLESRPEGFRLVRIAHQS